MDFNQRRILGRTGLSVGRLGVGSSYDAPAKAYEEAFERGVNYFYWGSLRKTSMAQAIRHIIKKGKREELKTLDLGPLNDEEMVRVRRIGDYVHDHFKKLIFR